MGQLPSAQAGEINKNYRNFIFLHYNHYWSIRTLQIWHLMHTGDQFGAHGGHRAIQNLFPLNPILLNPFSQPCFPQPCFSRPCLLRQPFTQPISLTLLPFTLFPSIVSCFPTFPQHNPHNQRISSLFKLRELHTGCYFV
jgi:hypothetical protein